MPYTKEMAFNKANKVKTLLANSKLALFRNTLVPNVNTPKASFTGAEADYDGYTAGGVTVTAFSGPFFDPAGGASIVSPNEYFAWVHDTDDVGNLIGGWWLEDSTGLVWAYGTFPEPISMAAAGDAIPMVITLTEGQNF